MDTNLENQIILIVLAALGIPSLIIVVGFVLYLFFGKHEVSLPDDLDPKGPWQE
jgi:hypothetical protein